MRSKTFATQPYDMYQYPRELPRDGIGFGPQEIGDDPRPKELGGNSRPKYSELPS